MTQIQAHLILRKGATPKFRRPYPIPFAVKDALGRELDRLESEGILRKVNHCDWAAPIVLVPKKDGTIRLCGDYKRTLNPALQVDQYPLPSIPELLASVAGGKRFTTLDLTSAYHQMVLDTPSSKPSALTKGSIATQEYPLGLPRHLQCSNVPWTPFSRVFPMCCATLMTYRLPATRTATTSRTCGRYWSGFITTVCV